jgi:hypothetical protein
MHSYRNNVSVWATGKMLLSPKIFDASDRSTTVTDGFYTLLEVKSIV